MQNNAGYLFNFSTQEQALSLMNAVMDSCSHSLHECWGFCVNVQLVILSAWMFRFLSTDLFYFCAVFPMPNMYFYSERIATPEWGLFIFPRRWCGIFRNTTSIHSCPGLLPQNKIQNYHRYNNYMSSNSASDQVEQLHDLQLEYMIHNAEFRNRVSLMYCQLTEIQ